MRPVNIAFLCVLGLLGSVQGQLQLGFYDQKCPNAEKIILDYVTKHIPKAPSLAAPLLRMHFHDCFVRGCDASVLINSTSSNSAEKDAVPNQSLRGFGFIDALKSLVEEECPGVVSCADIIALVARDAVVTIGGPYWRVPTGRRDGRVSHESEALNDIPGPFFNFSALQTNFAVKGLDVNDLVLLSGAHTIGIAHCNPSFNNRLFNFSGKGDTDPSLDSEYAAVLKKKCGNPSNNVTIFEMDPGSFRTFDLHYYGLLLKRRGLFESDGALITNSNSLWMIKDLLNAPMSKFFQEFALSMEKMGRIEVKTGTAGEIRKRCAVVN